MSVTTFKWGVTEAITTYLTTLLNGLVNSSSATTGKINGGTINNSVGLYQVISFELVAFFGSGTPTGGAYIGGWINYALDGVNFTDGGTGVDPARPVDFYIPVAASTKQQRILAQGIGILPYDFQVLIQNKTGTSMTGVLNTLKYTRTYEQGII